MCTNCMEIKISDFVQKRYDLNKLILLNKKLSCKSLVGKRHEYLHQGHDLCLLVTS